MTVLVIFQTCFSYLRYTTKHEQVYGSDILTVLSPWAGDVKLFGANWGQLTKDLWDYAHTHTHRSLSLARSLSLSLSHILSLTHTLSLSHTHG